MEAKGRRRESERGKRGAGTNLPEDPPPWLQKPPLLPAGDECSWCRWTWHLALQPLRLPGAPPLPWGRPPLVGFAGTGGSGSCESFFLVACHSLGSSVTLTWPKGEKTENRPWARGHGFCGTGVGFMVAELPAVQPVMCPGEGSLCCRSSVLLEHSTTPGDRALNKPETVPSMQLSLLPPSLPTPPILPSSKGSHPVSSSGHMDTKSYVGAPLLNACQPFMNKGWGPASIPPAPYILCQG